MGLLGYAKHQWRNKVITAPYGPVDETRLGEMETGIEATHLALTGTEQTADLALKTRGSLTLDTDSDASGAGDLIFRTHGVERARISQAGVGTGLLGGSQPYFSARDYGLGDGVTSAFTAIQAAITAAQDRLVYIPNPRIYSPTGVWDIGTNQLIFPYGPHLIGDDEETCVITYQATASPSSALKSWGSTGTAVALTADAAIGDTVLSVTTASIAGLAVGDRLLLRSNADWSATESGSKQGEPVLVESFDATTITLSGHIVDTYTVANTATVAKISYLPGRMEGVGFRNTDFAGLAQAVCDFRYLEGFEFDVAIDSNVGAFLALTSCLNGEADVRSRHGHKDYGASHTIAYGYGVTLTGACQGVKARVHCQDGHAGFTTNPSSLGGVPRNCEGDVLSWGDVEIPAHTHDTCEYITLRVKVLGSGQKGVTKPYGPAAAVNGKNCTVYANVADCYGSAIVVGAAALNTTIAGYDIENMRSAGSTPGRGIDIAGTNTTVLPGRIAGCENSGINNNGPGTLVDGSNITAGGSPGSKYSVFVNDGSDSGKYVNVVSSLADEDIHFLSPASPSPCVYGLTSLGSTKKTNKPGALVASAGETRALMLMGA